VVDYRLDQYYEIYLTVVSSDRRSRIELPFDEALLLFGGRPSARRQLSVVGRTMAEIVRGAGESSANFYQAGLDREAWEVAKTGLIDLARLAISERTTSQTAQRVREKTVAILEELAKRPTGTALGAELANLKTQIAAWQTAYGSEPKPKKKRSLAGVPVSYETGGL
jgi:hypothetical protein